MAPHPVTDVPQAVDDHSSRSERRRLQVEIRSVTKDSLGVAWYSDVISRVDETDRLQSSMTSPHTETGGKELVPIITGYKVRYQAVGSTYVQYSHLLKPTTAKFEITQLHENTYYDVCVKLFTINVTTSRRNNAGTDRDDVGIIRHPVPHNLRDTRMHSHRSPPTSADLPSTDAISSTSSVERGMYEAIDIEWGDDYNVVIAAEQQSFGVTDSPTRVYPARDGRDQTLPQLVSATNRLNTGSVGLSGSSSHRLIETGGFGQLTLTSCVKASTGVNSLSVALGSTFGAFLALGVIVAFVLAAKWQHVRRTRKLHAQLLQRLTDSNDSLMLAAAGLDGDVLMTAISADGTLQRVCFTNGDGCGDSGVIVVGGDSGDVMEVTSSTSAADSHHHQRYNPRILANGDIEMKRLHRPSDGGDGTANGYVDGMKVEYDEAVDIYYDDDNQDVDEGGSLSSDFSADIILHAGTDGPSMDDAVGDGEGTAGSKLVLDSATCAGSFILANDDPTGRTYSLLVPLSAVGVQPLLSSAISSGKGSETLIESGGNIGGLQLVKIAGGGGRASGVGPGVSIGGGQSIVRLKLRKHATVDYSTMVDIPDEYDEYRDVSGSTTMTEPSRFAASAPANATAMPGVRPSLGHHNVVINVQSATPTSAQTGEDVALGSGVVGRMTKDAEFRENGTHCESDSKNHPVNESGTLEQHQHQQQGRLREDEQPSVATEPTIKRSSSSVW